MATYQWAEFSLTDTLARAYFLSESYDRAETVLDELVPTIDTSQDHVRYFISANRVD